MYYCYDNNIRLETEKFSEFIKQKFWLIEGSGGVYGDDDTINVYNYENTDVDAFMKHTGLVDFLQDFFCCDLVADVNREIYMSDPYYSYYERGFFIVKNDIIVRYISEDYANGLFDGVAFCCKQTEEYKAK